MLRAKVLLLLNHDMFLFVCLFVSCNSKGKEIAYKQKWVYKFHELKTKFVTVFETFLGRTDGAGG